MKREIDAAKQADEFIKLILQYQSELLGKSALSSESQAKQVASSIAALRSELIDQLKGQP